MVILTRSSCESMVETRASSTFLTGKAPPPQQRAVSSSPPAATNPVVVPSEEHQLAQQVPLEEPAAVLPDRAVPRSLPHTDPIVEEPKPFFIMDWLDNVNEHDLQAARTMLQTQRHHTTAENRPSAKVVSPLASPTDLLLRPHKAASTFVAATTPPPPPPKDTVFRQRSIAIGNGWNAKGLRKAKLGLWKDALMCWENALEIRSQVLGDTHLDVANTCNNLGIACGKLNLVEQALEHLQRALTIRSVAFGPVSCEVAATLHNMGNVLQQAGKLEEAMACFCETKSLHEQVVGPHHVHVARACVAMGHTYCQAQEYDDAREAYRDALTIFHRAGLDDSDVEVQTIANDIQELDKLVDGGSCSF